MSKTDQIEALISATETEQKLTEKKLDIKQTEAKEKREHQWIYLIWSIGAIILLVIVLYGRANNWFF